MSNQTTIFPALVEVNAARNTPLLEQFTSYMMFVSGFTQELQTYLDYENSQYVSDFVNANARVLGVIDSDKTKYDSEFLIYYIKQYERTIQAVKNVMMPSMASIYSTFSDSIGLLANTIPTLNDSVIPLNDITNTIYSTVQICPANLVNKLSPNSKNIATLLYKNATTLYRNNLINIQTAWTTSNEAHGSNLITDFNAYLRMRSITPTLVSKLNADFDQLFNLVSYYCNLNDYSGYNPRDTAVNLQEIPYLTYTENVEGTNIELDLLGKKIIAARKNITLKQKLDASHNVATGNTFVQVPAVTKSINPTPINSTAVNVAQPTALPQVPTPVTTEQKSVETLKVAEQTKKNTPPTNIVSTPNPTIENIPTTTPEFSRDTYAYSGTSPFAAVGAIRDAVCRLSNLSLKVNGNFSLPTLPDAIKNFSFKNAFTALVARFEKTLKSIIAALPKPPNLAQIFKDFAKTYFTCNPGNKK